MSDMHHTGTAGINPQRPDASAPSTECLDAPSAIRADTKPTDDTTTRILDRRYEIGVSDRHRWTTWAHRWPVFTRLLTALPVALLVLATLLLIPIPSAPGPLRDSLGGSDYRAYRMAGRMVLSGERDRFYDLDVQFAHQTAEWPELTLRRELLSFLYPPFVAAVMAPIAALPLERGYLIWTAVEVVVLLVLLANWLAALPVASAAGRRFAAVLCLTYVPVGLTLIHGQLSFVLALAALLTWRELDRGREGRAGLWLALLAIKPQLLPVPVLVLLVQRRWRALGGLAAGLAVLGGISVAVVGWSGLGLWLRVLPEAARWGDNYGIHPQLMNTWRGLLHRLLATDDAAAVEPLWQAGVVVVGLVLIWAARRRAAPGTRRLALLWAGTICGVVVASPHLYAHDLMLLLVPAALLIRAARGRDRLDWWLIAPVAAWYLAAWAPHQPVEVLRCQLTVLVSGFALAVVAYRLATAAPEPATAPPPGLAGRRGPGPSVRTSVAEPAD